MRDGARPDDTKASRTGPIVAWPALGRPVWTPRDYAALAREGYQRNAVVHRAVRMVAEAAASVTLDAFEGEAEAPDHPILALLARPNPREGGAAFLEAVYGHLLVAGNAYVEVVSVDGEPRELHALRPDRMKVIPGPDGWPQGWEYTAGGRSVRFEAAEDGVPPILHLTLFHPLDDHYGLSPMEAAATALDIHNAAGAWNKALLDNSARPSGALVVETPQGIPLGEEQVQRLREELETGFQGPGRAGRPLLLEGGIDWKPLSLSPKDMDFVQAKAAAAREIALAFGVPPMLLGLPGDNTFANYAEANRGFWRQTVLPLVGRTAQSLAHWLGPAWEGEGEFPSPRGRGEGGAQRRMRGGSGGGPLRLVPDLDRVDALAIERRELWSRIGAAGFLTDDEKRAAVGYGARGGEGKGRWMGPDPIPGDLVATPGGIGTTVFGGPSWTFGPGSGSGGDGHWVNQPRVPAGNSDGGQWTAEGGVISGGEGGDLGDGGSGDDGLHGGEGDDDLTTGAGPRKDVVDLATEDVTNPGRRSHPAAKHVGLTREQIESTLNADTVGWLFDRRYPIVGAFKDLSTANRLVNEALAANQDIVEQTKNGVFANQPQVIRQYFNQVTGTEGYKLSEQSAVRFRENTGVLFLMQRDRSERGFRVITAYPINKDPIGYRKK